VVREVFGRVGCDLGGLGHGGHLIGVLGNPGGVAFGVGFLGQGQHSGPILAGSVFEPHDLREVRHVLAAGEFGKLDCVVVGHQVADAGGRFFLLLHKI
jgi:hypothetical protein